MDRRFSARSVQDFAKATALAAALVAAVTLVGAGAAGAETWSISLSSSSSGAKVDVYDVNAGKSVAKDRTGSFSVNAEAKKGGGSEVDKMGAHIRWMATKDGKCWWGQVCPTRNGVSASIGPLRPQDSVNAGNCKIEGKTPACGNSN